MICQCPHCRKNINIAIPEVLLTKANRRLAKKARKNNASPFTIPPGLGWKPTQTATMQQTAGAPPWADPEYMPSGPGWGGASNQSTEVQRETPTRAPGVVSDVVVPFLQSALTGAFITIPGVTVLILLQYEPGHAIRIAGTAGIAGASVWWFIKEGFHERLLFTKETAKSESSETPPEMEPAANPEPPALTFSVNYPSESNHHNSKRFQLPAGIPLELFYHWAQMVTDGTLTPARGNWCGKGRPFGRPKYDELLELLTDAGIVTNHGDGRGRVLTNAGHHILKQMMRQAGIID